MAEAQVAAPPSERASWPRAATEERRLDQAILRTVAYAGLFQCPLELGTLHRLLREVPASLSAVARRVRALDGRLELVDGWVVPRGHRDWLELHQLRRRHTERLLDAHAPLLRLLGRLPFVRLVALSGACAHDNATDGDVDVFLVTARDRVWLVAAGLFAAAKALGVRRTLCLNYLLDEGALALPERDAFTAAEIAGLRPLAGAAAYRRFVAANPWLREHVPNFCTDPVPVPAALPAAGRPAVERWLEPLAPLAESLARRLLGAWLARRIGSAPGVRLSRHRLKLHPVDHGPRVELARATAWRALEAP